MALAEFADLYVWALHGHQVTPSDLDRMEIWQIAAMFGLHKAGPGVPSPGRDPLAERIAAAKAGGGSASDRAALDALGTAVDAEVGGSLHGVAQVVTG